MADPGDASVPAAEPEPGEPPAPAGAHGPLHGVRVLDLTSVVMGPYATQILGDLGADVITVEPATGETNRVMGAGPHRQLSGVALNLLRNKRNIDIDLKHPSGRAAVLKVLSTCDVLVTNLRPGPLRRLGLAYQDVVEVRPGIVYCQAAGYPSDSPRADDPAYDDIVQAATGIADALHRTTGEPRLAPTIFADKLCGLTIAYAVAAALFHRASTGEGQHIEVPMVDTASAFMLVEHGAAAIPEPPVGPAGYPRILTPWRRPQQTLDGWVNVLPYTRENWARLFVEAGRPDLADDERIATGRARIGNAPFLYQQLASIMATRTTAEWLEVCDRLGIPATAVATLDELVAELPEADHPVAGRYRVIPPPVRFSRSPASVRRPAPLVGQHTREVLGEAGLSSADIDEVEEHGGGHRPRRR